MASFYIGFQPNANKTMFFFPPSCLKEVKPLKTLLLGGVAPLFSGSFSFPPSRPKRLRL